MDHRATPIIGIAAALILVVAAGIAISGPRPGSSLEVVNGLSSTPDTGLQQDPAGLPSSGVQSSAPADGDVTDPPLPEVAPPVSSSPSVSPTAFGPRPVPEGTYRYVTTGTSQINGDPPHDMPRETLLDVSAASPDGSQSQVRDLRDADGYGQITASDLRYAPRVMILSRVTTTTRVPDRGASSDTRTFTADPPGRLMLPGDAPGDSRTFTMTSDDTVLTFTVSVRRRDTITIGDRTVPALVLEQVMELSGDLEGRAHTTRWIRPCDGLTLREDSTADVTTATGRRRQQYTATLESLN